MGSIYGLQEVGLGDPVVYSLELVEGLGSGVYPQKVVLTKVLAI